MIDIALDDEASSHDEGKPFEQLAGVASQQPFPLGEMRMSRAAWDQLWLIRRRGIFARVGRAPGVTDELRALGLLDRLGGLTPAGEDLLRVRATAKIVFGVIADTGGRRRILNSWYSGREALVVAELPLPDGSTVMSIHSTTMSASFGLLISWMRIGPAWAFPHGEGRGEFDADLITHRIEAAPGREPALPEGASWMTARAWAAGEWTRYTVASPQAGIKYEAIRTGDVGWFHPEDLPDGRVRLGVVSSTDVMRSAVGLFFDTVDALRR